jgi:hypothetical protein
MNAIYLLFLAALMNIDVSHGFAPRMKASHPSSSSRSANSIRHKTSLNSIDAFSALLAMGDYAAEIEKGVGEEIYAPIFKSGIYIHIYIYFLIHLYPYIYISISLKVSSFSYMCNVHIYIYVYVYISIYIYICV